MTKVQWRAELRTRVGRLSVEEKARQSAAVCERIKSLERYRTAPVLLLYRSMANEVDLVQLWMKANQTGQQVFFPQLVSESAMRFVRTYPETRWRHHPLGFLEPEGNEALTNGQARQAVILVPGLGFSPSGARLGRGHGYYDRALAGLPIAGDGYRIGVGFAVQIIDDLPSGECDVAMHAVASATGIWFVEHDIKFDEGTGALGARRTK